MQRLVILLALIMPIPSYAENYFIANIGYAFPLGQRIIENDPDDLENLQSIPSRIKSFIKSDDLYAGSGYQTEVGYQQEFSKHVGMRLVIGYKLNTISIDDVSYYITSVPASLLLYYTVDRISFGGGIAYDINPIYKAYSHKSESVDDTVKFDNAMGYSLLLNLRVTRSELFSVGVRYTNISYEGAFAAKNNVISPPQRSSSAYDASSLALFGIFKF